MMPARKTETLTIRLCPETKVALSQAAERERRSLSNMLEVMIRNWIDTPERYCDPRTVPLDRR